MSNVRVLVVGGIDHLHPFYRDAPRGIDVDVAKGDSPSLEARAESADAVVLVTGFVSHAAADKIRGVVRRRGIPLASATGGGVSRVRASIAEAFALARSA